jgi:hypothetical protein
VAKGRLPWSAIATILVAFLAALAWLARRAWLRIREERRMLMEAYAYIFGAEELGYDLADESAEERLRRGKERFSWFQDALAVVVENQQEIRNKQRELAEGREEDIDVPPVRDLPDWEEDRYRDENREE